MPSFCSVVKCGMRGERDRVSFFRIPAVLTNRGDYLIKLSVQRRDAWISVLKRGPPSESQLKTWRVCSRHFIEGKPSALEENMHPDWIPTQNMGYTTSGKPHESAASRYERFERRKRKKVAIEEHVTTKVYSLVPRTSLNEVTCVEERSAMTTVIASTLNTENSDTFIKNPKKTTMKKKKVHEYSSDRPNILHRTKPGSKVAKLISPKDDLTNVHILKDIKTQNPNIEVEYVDVKMEPQDNTYKSVDEPATELHEKPSDDLILVDSSEYNDLFKENELLKQLLTKTGLSSNIESSGDNSTSTESNYLIDLTNIHRICRVCLKISDNLVSMNEKLMFENKNILEMTVLETIQSIVGDRVDVDDNFPRQICPQCQNHLKLFITFKYTFNKASSILRSYVNGPLENNNKQHISGSASKDHDYTKQNILKNEVCCKVESEECEIDIGTENVDILQVENEDLPKLVNTIPSNTYRNLSKIETKKQKMKLHTCPICWIKVSMSKLIPHVKSHKTLEKYLNIPKVSPKTRFYAPARDVKGLLSGESEKLHKCPICSYEFKATEYILHVHHHLTHDQFKCEKCHRTFKKKSYLLSHILIHSKHFPFRCEKCNKGFVIKANYECHLLTHEGGELPHKCVECSKSFSNPKHLSRHMTIHTENRTYSTKYRYKRCKYCGQGFSQKELVEHVCHQWGVYKCKYCYKVFLNARTRQLHIHSVHFKGNKNPGYCPICNLTFKNIIYHKASKHPNDKMKALCTVCGLYVSNIYTHMMKHRKVPVPKSYQCQTCSKLFSYRTTLKKHVLIHSGLKPYICSYCGKAFNCSYNLKVHERIHIGDRCHVCPICDKGFLEKSYLNKHMKTHKEVDVDASEMDYSNIQIDNQDLYDSSY